LTRPKAQDGGREKIRRLFEAHPDEEIPLSRILGLFVAQYNTRILELRREGMTIENRTEWREGVRHSWFRYRPK
jgi:hypothetical protein